MGGMYSVCECRVCRGVRTNSTNRATMVAPAPMIDAHCVSIATFEPVLA